MVKGAPGAQGQRFVPMECLLKLEAAVGKDHLPEDQLRPMESKSENIGPGSAPQTGSQCYDSPACYAAFGSPVLDASVPLFSLVSLLPSTHIINCFTMGFSSLPRHPKLQGFNVQCKRIIAQQSGCLPRNMTDSFGRLLVAASERLSHSNASPPRFSRALSLSRASEATTTPAAQHGESLRLRCAPAADVGLALCGLRLGFDRLGVGARLQDVHASVASLSEMTPEYAECRAWPVRFTCPAPTQGDCQV